MKKLARDIVDSGGIYEPPLIYPEGQSFMVFDGNRRITCMKLLANPKRAPLSELQKFFGSLKAEWSGAHPAKIICRVEIDRDEIDEILFRRGVRVHERGRDHCRQQDHHPEWSQIHDRVEIILSPMTSAVSARATCSFRTDR